MNSPSNTSSCEPIAVERPVGAVGNSAGPPVAPGGDLPRRAVQGPVGDGGGDQGAPASSEAGGPPSPSSMGPSASMGQVRASVIG